MSGSPRNADAAAAMELAGGADGFRMHDASGWTLAADRAGDGWTLHGAGRIEGLTLRREPAPADGFTLVDPEGAERGRTFGDPDGGSGRPPRFLLLEDGTLWRLDLRGPRDPRWELRGWETPGACLVVRPHGPAGWRVELTPAGRGLGEREALLALLAAEVVLAGGET